MDRNTHSMSWVLTISLPFPPPVFPGICFVSISAYYIESLRRKLTILGKTIGANVKLTKGLADVEAATKLSLQTNADISLCIL